MRGAALGRGALLCACFLAIMHRGAGKLGEPTKRAPRAILNWQDRQFEADLKRAADLIAAGRAPRRAGATSAMRTVGG